MERSERQEERSLRNRYGGTAEKIFYIVLLLALAIAGDTDIDRRAARMVREREAYQM